MSGLASPATPRLRIDPTRACAIGTLVVSAVAGGYLGVAHPSVDAFLIAAIAVACAVPLVLRVLQRRFDIFEPIVTANLALMVMFVAQPAALLSADRLQIVFKGYDITENIRETLVMTLVGVVALQIGYALPWARYFAARLPSWGGGWDTQATVAFSIGLIVVACALFSVFLVQSGGFGVVVGMIEGRAAVQDQYFRNSSAYFYGAPQLIWPASLLLFALGIEHRRRAFVVLSIVCMIPLAIFAGGQGARIILIPLLMAPGIFYYLSRGRRPRPLTIAIVFYLLFTVGIAYFRDTRVAGDEVSRVAELKHALTDPTYEFEELVFNGVDNDMFQSLASQAKIIPEKLEASPVMFIYRVAAKPVPSMLWKGKPLGPEETVTTTLYPGETVRASSSSGVIGSFLLAGQLPGIAIGMLLLGVAFRLPWEWWRRFPNASVPQLFLTTSIMFIPISLRGGLGETIAHVIFKILPLVIAVRLCMRAASREST